MNTNPSPAATKIALPTHFYGNKLNPAASKDALMCENARLKTLLSKAVPFLQSVACESRASADELGLLLQYVDDELSPYVKDRCLEYPLIRVTSRVERAETLLARALRAISTIAAVDKEAVRELNSMGVDTPPAAKKLADELYTLSMGISKFLRR